MSTAHVFPAMGTVVSLRTSRRVGRAVLHRVEALFVEYDALFSRYRSDSAVSRLARREIALAGAGPVVEAAFERATRWRAATDGAFTPHAADGSVDLTGIAKALAIERSSAVLDGEVPGWLLNVGGDLAWRAAGSLRGRLCGVSDPDDPQALLCAVPLDAGWSAAATSGTSERGEHIVRTDRTAGIRQATVLAPDIVTADVLATAIVAGGEEQFMEAVARDGVDVIAVTARGEMLLSDGAAEHLVGLGAGHRPVGRQRHRAS